MNSITSFYNCISNSNIGGQGAISYVNDDGGVNFINNTFINNIFFDGGTFYFINS